MSLPPFLYPGEIEIGVWPFAHRLEAGETISAFEVESIAAVGIDATPEDILEGSPALDGTTVLHRIKGKVGAERYKLVAKATGSTGLVHYEVLFLRCIPL
jgi:hypothetical protein